MGSSLSRRVQRLPEAVSLDEARATIGRSRWSHAQWDALPKDATGRASRDDLLAALKAGTGAKESPSAARVRHQSPIRAGRVSGSSAGAGGAGAGHAAGGRGSQATSAAGTRGAPAGEAPAALAKAGGAAAAPGPAKLPPSGRSRVEVRVRAGHMMGTTDTAWLLKDIGGSERLVAVAKRFYGHAFKDKMIDEFIESHSDPHGQRLGTWIAEKMGGEGPIWTKERGADARSAAHYKAWHSHKRPRRKQGRRFKLDDCRVWMRLMFWSAREEGLADHALFWDWFVRFIAHFIRIYANTAPPYAPGAAAWSANPDNLARYEEQGFYMKEVHGVGVVETRFV